MNRLVLQKLTIAFISIIGLNSCAKNDVIQPQTAYTSIELKTQNQVDQFNYSEIKGSLLIFGEFITSLEGLNCLTHISGDLIITGNDMLNSLEGLEHLESIGGTLAIFYNFGLKSLNGLQNLSHIDSISINQNFNLPSLNALQGVTQLMSLCLSENKLLNDLTGLENITSIKSINISNNNSLRSLEGLNSLNSTNYIYLNNNPSLKDFCAITNMINNLEIPWLIIEDNAYNPTYENFEQGECSKVSH